MTNEFQTTTVIESTNPTTDTDVIMGNSVFGGMFGLNQDIKTARMFGVAERANGEHVGVMVVYKHDAETPLQITEKTISDVVHNKLLESFDKINNVTNMIE